MFPFSKNKKKNKNHINNIIKKLKKTNENFKKSSPS